MDFDNIDNGYIAKIMVGEGDKVLVGTPLIVVVDEESDIAAFADSKHTDFPNSQDAQVEESAPVVEETVSTPTQEST